VLVYQNDFESPVGAEWSTALRDTTPLGARAFLGQFSGESATLNVDAIPAHSELTVSFQLFVILTWDGNFSSNPVIGPDVWDLSVSGGPTLIHTTFSNGPIGTSQPPQAFPDAHPGGSHPFMTGASEVYTLGFMRDEGEGVLDAVYNLSFTFPHTSSSLSLVFSTSQMQGIADEAWGIDSILINTESSVDVSPVFEGSTPSTALLPIAPNPMTEFTHASFSLGHAQFADLSVYAIDGRRVRTLTLGKLPAGRHDLVWDGRDGQGRVVPSGTYLMRLGTAVRVQSRRITILR
jgi:hypothetical protein